MRLTRPRKSFPIIALNLVIVLILGGGTAAYAIMNKTVTLTVDGRSHTIRTFSDRVSDVLATRDITVRRDDRLSLAPSHQLADGDTIDLAYAKPVTLAVDGAVSEHTVYDATVGQALQSLAVQPKPGAYVSAKATTTIPRSGGTLVVSSPKKLKVVADGKKSTVSTTAPTVGGVLEAARITMDGDDEVRPGLDAYVSPDSKLRVVRIEKVTRTETVSVKYPVKVRDNAEALKGERTVVAAGKVGKKREKVALILADGKVRKREVLTSRTLSAPRPQIVTVGTRQPAPDSAAPGVASDSVWDKIAQCESGGNWQINTGNGYYGGLQFSAATWHSVGGPGLPHQNSRETQIKYAKILQARSGWGQWGCAGARFN